MAASVWSQLRLDDPATQRKLAAVGNKALAAGEVDPGQALQVARAMGVLPGGNEDPATMAVKPALSMSGPQAAPSALSMSPADMYSQVASAPTRLGAKESLSDTNQDTRNFKRSTNRLLTKSPEQAALELKLARGVLPGIKQDLSGNNMYEQATDDQGRPVTNPDTGAPVYDKDRPIYDESKDVVDPNNPITQQQAGVDRLQELLKAKVGSEQMKSHMDFSPLARLADAVNAEHGNTTHVAEGVAPPTDPTTGIMSFADEIQKRRADIQKAIFENQKNLRGGSALEQLAQATLVKQVAGAEQGNPPLRNPNMPTQNYDKWNKLVQSTLKDDDKFSAQAGTILDEVKQGNPINDSRIAVVRASMDAHGRPNMAEVAVEGGNRAVVEKAKQAYENLTSGKLTDANRELQVQSMQAIADYLALRRQVQVNRLKNMGAQYQGVTPDKISATLPDAYAKAYNPPPGSKPAAAPTPAPNAAQKASADLSKMTPEELKAYIAAHGGP